MSRMTVTRDMTRDQAVKNWSPSMGEWSSSEGFVPTTLVQAQFTYALTSSSSLSSHRSHIQVH